MRLVHRPDHRLITEVSLGIICALLLIGSAIAQTPPATLPGGLERVQNSQVKLAYVRPGTDFSKYKTIELMKLSVPPSARNGAPPGAMPEFGESYILGNEQVAALQSAYEDSMHRILGNAGFKFVNTPQADTLIVIARITSIRLSAPISNDYGGMETTFSRGAGAMAMAAVFGDGATNTVIAEAADAQYPSNMWTINNSVTNLADARQAFDTWARDLRDKLKQK